MERYRLRSGPHRAVSCSRLLESFPSGFESREVEARRPGRGEDAATGEQAVPHGLRSAFRTWVAERTGFDGDMAEVALFHKVGSKVAQAYNRADQIERRRAMMGAWCDFLSGRAPEKVVPIAEAQA